ncbi:hypothetical protein chiPu_0013279 [Chiloscyllium punctatum]|uniref:Uncharacterized protein n=1 Tax=Chiloscyllium punctatum TaxID=137246 RepID=A0A401SWM0_CHIPU|nr:hypothetical protein [Chiloscyllium punctatum]
MARPTPCTGTAQAQGMARPTPRTGSAQAQGMARPTPRTGTAQAQGMARPTPCTGTVQAQGMARPTPLFKSGTVSTSGSLLQWDCSSREKSTASSLITIKCCYSRNWEEQAVSSERRIPTSPPAVALRGIKKTHSSSREGGEG